MAEVVLKIKRWGNNLGIRLPAAVTREAHLHVDQRVRISVEGDQVVITPVNATRLTLEQRLATYDPQRHGGEQMGTTRTLVAGKKSVSPQTTALKRKSKSWVPDRQDIIWIDCNPQIGREMRDVHPFLVLSPRIFNEKLRWSSAYR